MLWVLLALAAHAGNALVFVVDKSLLQGKSQMSDPLKYTFYSAVLAVAAVVLLVFGWVPLTWFIVGWSAIAAVLYVAALWMFFAALKKGEPSRVVPIAGAAVPAFTLLLAVVFLGEVLKGQQLLATWLLILGGVLLSVRWRGVKGLPRGVLAGAVVSGLFFAGYYVVMKYVYENTDAFLVVFAYSRIVQAVVAVVFLFPVLLLSQQAILCENTRRPPQRGGRARARHRSPRLRRGTMPAPAPHGFLGKILTDSSIVFVLNKTLAAGAFILLNWAISLGSVTVVNALQGAQYVWLLLLAVAVSVWWPKLFREELTRVALWQKISGIVLVSLGVVLLA